MDTKQGKGGYGKENYDPETGKYVSDDIGPIKLENEKEFHMDASFFAAAKKLKAKKHMPSEEDADDMVSSSVGYVPNAKAYAKMTAEEKKSLLLKSPNGYEALYLETASEKQLDALLMAEATLNGKIQLEQRISVLDDKKEKVKAKYDKMLAEYGGMLPNNTVYGVWLGYVSVAEYEKKAEKDQTGFSPIDKKKDYYEVLLGDPSETESAKQHAKEKLDQLNAFEDAGKKYLDYKNNEIAPQMSAELSAIEEKQQKLYQDQAKYGDGFEAIRLKAQSYIDRFQDKNAAYSKFRKDNALWITKDYLKEKLGYDDPDDADVVRESIKYFGTRAKKMWDSMTANEKSRIYDYTGAYSKYNGPLRGYEHYGWSGFDFEDAVTEMTDAIDKCSWDEDIWLQRGINDSKMFSLPGSDEKMTLDDIASAEGGLQSIVGTVFHDDGFYSAGSAKGTGFDTQPIIINTYCPKGTKMAYVNFSKDSSHYGKGHENEMILQRGYTFRITKVEKKGWKTFVDVEVILGSDADKVTDKSKLHEMKVKYLGGY